MIYMTNKIIAIQGNHPSKLNPKSDTTIFLALEAQNKNYKIFYYEPNNLSIIKDKVIAKGYFVNFSYSKKNFFKIIEKKTIDLSKCTCMPLDGVSGQPHCIEMTEMHGDTETILAAPTAEIQVAWLEAMLSTKTKTMGLGRLNVIKCAAALKNVKRRAKMPSM